MRTLHDALEKRGLTGDYTPLRELLDQEIIITSVTVVTTRYGESVRVGYELDGQSHQTLASSGAIKDKLTAVVDDLPVSAKVVAKTAKASGNVYFDLV